MNPVDEAALSQEWFADDEWSALQTAWQNEKPQIAVDDHAFLKKIKKRVRFNQIWNQIILGNNLFWLITFAYLAYHLMTHAPMVLALPYTLFLGPMMGYVTLMDYRVRRQAGDIENQETHSYLEAAIQHCKVAVKLRRRLHWVYLYCILFIIGYGIYHQTVAAGRYANDRIFWGFSGLVLFYVLWICGSWRWMRHKERERSKYEKILAQYEADGALPDEDA